MATWQSRIPGDVGYGRDNPADVHNGELAALREHRAALDQLIDAWEAGNLAGPEGPKGPKGAKGDPGPSGAGPTQDEWDQLAARVTALENTTGTKTRKRSE